MMDVTNRHDSTATGRAQDQTAGVVNTDCTTDKRRTINQVNANLAASRHQQGSVAIRDRFVSQLSELLNPLQQRVNDIGHARQCEVAVNNELFNRYCSLGELSWVRVACDVYSDANNDMASVGTLPFNALGQHTSQFAIVCDEIIGPLQADQLVACNLIDRLAGGNRYQPLTNNCPLYGDVGPSERHDDGGVGPLLPGPIQPSTTGCLMTSKASDVINVDTRACLLE